MEGSFGGLRRKITKHGAAAPHQSHWSEWP